MQPQSPLAHSATYQLVVRGGAAGIADFAGNTLVADFTSSFTTAAPLPPAPDVTDTTIADFGAGTSNGGTRVASIGDGALALGATLDTSFDGVVLPAGWSAVSWNPGSSTVVANGRLTVDGERVSTDDLYLPGRQLEFVGTFTADAFQHVGFGLTLNETPWAIFSTASGGGLFARTHSGTVATETPIPGTWFNTPHRYRIDWLPGSVVFSIDGVQVATHSVTIAQSMRPIVSDFNAGGSSIIVDAMTMSPYVAIGTFRSRVLDAGSTVTWALAAWNATTPPGTTLSVSLRMGNTPTPDGTWTSFVALGASGAAVTGSARYLQYEALLESPSGTDSPVLSDITFSAGGPGTPTVSVADISVNETDAGITNATFTVTLSAASSQSITVNYSTTDGTAGASGDYTLTAGTATISAGMTSVQITVPVTGDVIDEANETFTLNLSGAVNATIAEAPRRRRSSITTQPRL